MEENKAKIVRHMAEILSGLCVPRSIGGVNLLGAAVEPWDRIVEKLGLWGYFTADEAEDAIKRHLLDIYS